MRAGHPARYRLTMDRTVLKDASQAGIARNGYMQQDNLHIRPADPANTAAALRLFAELHRHNAQLDPRFALADNWAQLVEDYLRQSQQSDDSVWLLACHNGTAIGFVLVKVHTDLPLYRHRGWAEIVGLYVDPAYRGTGVAHLLMEQAYARARIIYGSCNCTSRQPIRRIKTSNQTGLCHRSGDHALHAHPRRSDQSRRQWTSASAVALFGRWGASDRYA